MLYKKRKLTRRKINEISEYIGCHEKSIFYIEKRYSNNHFIRYLMFLRKYNIDLNKLFDELVIEKEK